MYHKALIHALDERSKLVDNSDCAVYAQKDSINGVSPKASKGQAGTV